MKSRILSVIKKVLVLVIGLPLLGVGVVLVPLPGPGLPIIALALFILGIEFQPARQVFVEAKQKIAAIYDKSFEEYRQRTDKL